MSYERSSISDIITDEINRKMFLPAIQREYVWSTNAVEKLFDSIMNDFPISSFLFWKIREENKKDWLSYSFINNFDKEHPHNEEADLSGVNNDIYLVLDGQQRLTSLYIGLKGSYKYFYYNWKQTKLYLNLLKTPVIDEDDPEKLTYQFEFKEADKLNTDGEYWYPVGKILDFDDAEDAKDDLSNSLDIEDKELQKNAKRLIGRLHSKIHTNKLINYYEEKTTDYDKVVEIFIRTNTGGEKLEYSDLLLSTATAKWKSLNARKEIHDFTDEINRIGSGYNFGKDFVLKGCLYLTEELPIQYKIKNFTKTNLEKIENNWEIIKGCIKQAIKLVSRFGIAKANIPSEMAILPIALYLKNLGKNNYYLSSNQEDVVNQKEIQKWLLFVFLKGAFGGGGDTKLKSCRDVILAKENLSIFPSLELSKALKITHSFNEDEIKNLLSTNYSTRNSFLILSLLYPDRDWKDNVYHEDHIYPKSLFTKSKLNKRGYNENKVNAYMCRFNTIANLQLLTDTENLEKNSTNFSKWLPEKDQNFKSRHSIPTNVSYEFDEFEQFFKERKNIIVSLFRSLGED